MQSILRSKTVVKIIESICIIRGHISRASACVLERVCAPHEVGRAVGKILPSNLRRCSSVQLLFCTGAVSAPNDTSTFFPDDICYHISPEAFKDRVFIRLTSR